MLTTNLHLSELLHREHLASIRQAAEEERRLRLAVGHNTPGRQVQHTSKLVLHLSGTLAAVLAILR